ncbi:MAG: glycosyltransferase family 2 protein [Lysobacterales bacterium]
MDELAVSVVVPTYQREQVLIDTARYLMAALADQGELILVDQTPQHEAEVAAQLQAWHDSGALRWLRRVQPSIPAAMNAGLLAARGAVVIYVDDDVIPDEGFIEAHLAAHRTHANAIVAGRVLQPWHVDGSAPLEGLAGSQAGPIAEFIGCNFSFPRALGMSIGGFDEQFVKVAYRFEAEFGLRALRSGATIQFWPTASLTHLRAGAGGTRSYGDHLRTLRPAHSVGEYYYLFASRPSGWLGQAGRRLFRSALTRHHLRHPWWIPATWISELAGLTWALRLWAQGRRLVKERA